MYSVIIVDDEPAALQHMRTIIERKCRQFCIVGQAEDGVEAIRMAQQLQPDLVITDVRMPIMDGIELSFQLRKILPECLVVVVSGYQDFEYMKGALKADVTDYLLKPVTPKNMDKVMNDLVKRLERIYYEKRNKLVHQMVTKHPCSEGDIKKYFAAEHYYAGIIRKNGLLRRIPSISYEVYSQMDENYFVYGRDEMESLFIIPETFIFSQSFSGTIRRQMEKMSESMTYITAVSIEESFDVGKIPEAIQRLYYELDTKSVVGLEQHIQISLREKGKNSISDELVQVTVKQLQSIIPEHDFDSFRSVLLDVMQQWNMQKVPQIWMERFSKELLYEMRRYNGYPPYDSQYEFQIEDAFYYAGSVEELHESLSFIYEMNYDPKNTKVKVDSYEFFEGIKGYIHTHYDGSVSLQTLCKTFGVSQSYVSRLFRKYENTSFSHYLTQLRIDEAKKLMEMESQFYIKDIAAMVGYSDQFYFSRIFRTLTNQSPTEYIDHIRSTKNETN